MTETPEQGLRRVLGPVSATCVVVGAIVGVGIFFTPSKIAAVAGSGQLALLAWAIGGTIAMLGALTFAELGGLYPRSGGQYDILRDSYGPAPAFIFVFCNATAIQTGAVAIIALVCAQNIGWCVVGAAPAPWLTPWLAAGLVIGLAGANIAGVRWGAGIQNATTFAKIATLLVICALAALGGSAAVTGPTVEADSAPALGVRSALFAALVPVMFSFGGWQHALWIAGEVRRPRRDVPLSIILGVTIVITVYMLANWAYLRLLGPTQVAASPAIAADAVGVVWPRVGARLVAAAVAVSAFGVLNAQLLSGPRLLYGMARDGRFFRVFGEAHARFATPVAAIVLIGGIALVLLAVGGFEAIDRLVNGVVFIDGIFFALTGAALFVLRTRRASAERPLRVPGYPVVPALFVLGETAVVVGALLDPTVRSAAVIGVAWIVGAAFCYAVFFRR